MVGPAWIITKPSQKHSEVGSGRKETWTDLNRLLLGAVYQIFYLINVGWPDWILYAAGNCWNGIVKNYSALCICAPICNLNKQEISHEFPLPFMAFEAVSAESTTQSRVLRRRSVFGLKEIKFWHAGKSLLTSVLRVSAQFWGCFCSND